jgi:hypothetical protein
MTKPVIGVLDHYGLRSIPANRLNEVLNVAEGREMPNSKGILEDRLVLMKGVTRANVEAICCSQGKAIFYIGIEERGARHLDLREFPTNDSLALPEGLGELYAQLLAATSDAAHRNETAEDWSAGYSLMINPDARKIQLQFPDLASEHLKLLRQILREGADPNLRVVAATVLGYAPLSQNLIEDLQFALRDPEQEVRANALRSLAPIALYTRRNPNAEKPLFVLTTWFVEMLNSVAWQDRMNSMNLLLELTADRDPKLIQHLKESGIPALAEMAMWKHLPHALPAYIILGRTAGMTEQEIQDTWSANQREVTIKKLRKQLKS